MNLRRSFMLAIGAVGAIQLGAMFSAHSVPTGLFAMYAATVVCCIVSGLWKRGSS